MELSVVLPCLNEAETLSVCIRKARASMNELGIDGEVVIADNGSTDGSQDIARSEGARVVDVPTRGYGAALIAGITDAKGTFVIMGDADDSYDLSNLGPFVEALRGGAELVMGNRFAGGIAPGAMPALHRYLGNPVLTAVGRVLFRSPVKDFHCGLRGFRRDAILELDLRTTGMEFASEMVVKATLNKLTIVEVPTTLSPDGRSRPPHLRTWRDGWRHLRFLLLYSPKWLFLYPGIVVFLLGLILGGALLRGPINVGDHALDVSALVYSMAAVLIGFQAILFAAFSRAFVANEGLMPPSPGMQKAFRVLNLERGLIIGLAMFFAGFALAIYGLVHWGSTDFGALNARNAIRLAVPAATLSVLGVETIMGSFFLSVLGLSRR
jgi:glycosyltransferase involved in cell wall biosynthesis